MKKQTSTHIPFKKPFWKLLGVSVLSFAFLYGGLVWAATYSVTADCELKRGSISWGEVCQKLETSGGKAEFLFTVPDVSDASGTAKGGVNHVAGLVGKTVKITNTGSQKLFVPVRSATELNAFLAARQRSTNPIDVTACEHDKYDQLPSDFNNGLVGCDSYDWETTEWTSCGGGGGSCGGTYTNATGQCVGTVNGSIDTDGSSPGPYEGWDCDFLLTEASCYNVAASWRTHGYC